MEMDVPARPTVSFAECLSSTFAEQHIADFRSPITNEVKGAIQQCRISTFPDFLIIQLKVIVDLDFVVEFFCIITVTVIIFSDTAAITVMLLFYHYLCFLIIFCNHYYFVIVIFIIVIIVLLSMLLLYLSSIRCWHLD